VTAPLTAAELAAWIGIADERTKERDAAEAELTRLTAELAHARAQIAALSEDNERLQAALRHSESELTRIIKGVWTAPNSPDTLVWWMRDIRDRARIALNTPTALARVPAEKETE
jgi:septal ring factor EnvC (AmiA/AmiB activator)